jgi:transcriptional regulator with XRE-family HTH domain
MKMNNKLEAFVEDSKNTDTYWVEDAKLKFSISLENQRKASKMTYASIAKKIGSSAAYITKVFRGDSNLTIETMVKLARSTGGKLEVHVVDASKRNVDWSLTVLTNPMHKRGVTWPSSTQTDLKMMSANNESYKWPREMA